MYKKSVLEEIGMNESGSFEELVLRLLHGDYSMTELKERLIVGNGGLTFFLFHTSVERRLWMSEIIEKTNCVLVGITKNTSGLSEC